MPVAFSDFLLEGRSGHVESVLVHGREYVYELKGMKGNVPKHATGPRATKAEIEAALRPDDEKKPPPTIVFE